MKLTENFTLEEFACKDGTAVPLTCIKNVRKVAQNLQVLRGVLGVPITINSGYRTPEYNRKIKGASNSFHMKGMAADIVCKGVTPQDVGDTIKRLINEGKMTPGGVNVYPTFVHYDVRGKLVSW